MKVFSLLVGVSDYPPGISSLPGCRNDLQAMRAFWDGYAEVNRVDHELLVLENADATRQGVIDGFRHFDRAGENDVCVFYYTGHGGQVQAPPELMDRTTNGRLETLVLHDSRTAGGRDLTDKEISYLLHHHTRGAGQVLVLLDSCHSGQATRGDEMVAKLAPSLKTVYRFDSLHGATATGPSYPPQRAHVALAACKNKELAYEMNLEGTRRGLFTYALLEAMGASDLATTSYEELVDRVTTRIVNKNPRQHAYAEAVPAGDALKQVFLDGSLKYNRQYVLDHDRASRRWFVSMGQLQGITEGATGLVLDGDTERDITVTTTDANRSYVSEAAWMDTDAAPYPVVRLEQTIRPLRLFAADLPGGMVEDALRKEIGRHPDRLQFVEDPTAADYKLVYVKGLGVTLTRPGEDRPLLEPARGEPRHWKGEFVERLLRVGKFEHSLAFRPAGHGLDLNRFVEITFEAFDPVDQEATELPQDGTAVLHYRHVPGRQTPYRPEYRLTIGVRPEAPRSLYVGALYFDEEFAISGRTVPVTELEPGQRVRSSYTDKQGNVRTTVGVSIPPYLHRDFGVTEIRNFIKVIVSEDPLSLSEHYQQGAYRAPEPAVRGSGEHARGEDFGEEEEDDFLPRQRWGERTIPFTIHRPLVAEGGAEAAVRLVDQPAGFSVAGIHLESSASTTRGVDSPLPPFPTGPAGLPAADLLPSRSASDHLRPLDLVELTGVAPEQAALVSEAAPLRLQVAGGGGERLIAFGYDEEFGSYFPAGFALPGGDIEIQQLPEPSAESYTRSFGGSVKLFFRKMLGEYTGLELETNQLRAVEVGAADAVTYRTDADGRPLSEEALTAEVGQASRIALFVHGIIGDTLTSPTVLQRAQAPDGSPLADHYDLVLAYDYENLRTPVPVTAAALRDRLAAVGLGPDHGKTLHVYAHSMGGLVSRYFVEQLGGDRVVGHLLQFGTPNGGSPYGKVVALVTVLMSRALKAGIAWQPWLSPLLAGEWFMDKATVTLNGMSPGSDLLETLAARESRPPVPYWLINGDTRLIPGAPEDAKFLTKVMGRFRLTTLVDAAFFREPNDIAVSVASQQAIPPPEVEERTIVPCDHMSYFVDEHSIRALESYLPRLL